MYALTLTKGGTSRRPLISKRIVLELTFESNNRLYSHR